MRTEIESALPARRCKEFGICLIGTLRDRDAELITQRLWDLILYCGVPSTDKHRGNGGDDRREPRIDAPLDAAQERIGRRQVLLTGEQTR